MNEETLKQIERNTRRTANNTAFITWSIIISAFGALGLALITFA